MEAILRLKAPKTKRQLRHFLGMINYYRDMWRRRSHVLAPLTKLVGSTAKYIWGEEQRKAFEEIKRVISEETMLSFPDFDKEFHVNACNWYFFPLGVLTVSAGPIMSILTRLILCNFSR